MDANEITKKLAAPFPAADVEWRAGAKNGDETKALALAYITSRAVMNRLDDVMGCGGWRDEYAKGPDGGVLCGMSLKIDGEWITKWDGAENSDFEAVKGGLSDAFKRAAVKWGIGRYLYNLDGVWTPCEKRGKTVVLKETPKLPAWALPANAPRQSVPQPSQQSEKPQVRVDIPAPEAASVKSSNTTDTPAPSNGTPASGNGNGHETAPVYTGKTCKIGKNSYPYEWGVAFADPKVGIFGRIQPPHVDGILQKLELDPHTRADVVRSILVAYEDAKDRGADPVAAANERYAAAAEGLDELG